MAEEVKVCVTMAIGGPVTDVEIGAETEEGRLLFAWVNGVVTLRISRPNCCPEEIGVPVTAYTQDGVAFDPRPEHADLDAAREAMEPHIGQLGWQSLTDIAMKCAAYMARELGVTTDWPSVHDVEADAYALWPSLRPA